MWFASGTPYMTARLGWLVRDRERIKDVVEGALREPVDRRRRSLATAARLRQSG
jgi:hypothetical protein